MSSSRGEARSSASGAVSPLVKLGRGQTKTTEKIVVVVENTDSSIQCIVVVIL
jgi:hypothetical protein